MPNHQLNIASFPKSHRDRLIEIATKWSLDLAGMNQAEAQECVKRGASEVDIVIVIFPDPDALPDHNGLSFAVIKGFEKLKEGGAGKKLIALALSDEQQVVAAEQALGDARPLN